MSQHDAQEGAKRLRTHGIACRVRRLPGVGDGFQILVTRADGSKTILNREAEISRLLRRWVTA